MLPHGQLALGVAAGDVARLLGSRPVDVPLFWQRWRLGTDALATLTDESRAARAGLRRVARTPDPR